MDCKEKKYLLSAANASPSKIRLYNVINITTVVISESQMTR